MVSDDIRNSRISRKETQLYADKNERRQINSETTAPGLRNTKTMKYLHNNSSIDTSRLDYKGNTSIYDRPNIARNTVAGTSNLGISRISTNKMNFTDDDNNYSYSKD